MVSIEISPGIVEDITGKLAMEQAIMMNNEEKYKQLNHMPFFQFPLLRDFGFKELTTSVQAALASVYESNQAIDP